MHVSMFVCLCVCVTLPRDQRVCLCVCVCVCVSLWAGSWFMLDVAFYGLGLNSAIVLQTIGYADSKNVYEKLYHSAVGNLILIMAGSFPGYWV